MAAINLLGFSRDSDAATVALRTGEDFELADLFPPTNHSAYAESTDSDSSDELSRVFTTSDKSSTKPTSAGTGYIIDHKEGKGEVVVSDGPSSVTATHGSGSDSELENPRELLGVGCWAGSSYTPKRPSMKKHTSDCRVKKPVVLIQHTSRLQRGKGASDKPCLMRSGNSKYLRNRNPSAFHNHDLEVQRPIAKQSFDSLPKGLSNTRITIVLLLASACLIAIGLAVFGICHTDQKQLGVIKAIIMGATFAVVVFTSALMVAARRDLLEILVALMLELLMSAIPTFHIHDLL